MMQRLSVDSCQLNYGNGNPYQNAYIPKFPSHAIMILFQFLENQRLSLSFSRAVELDFEKLDTKKEINLNINLRSL